MGRALELSILALLVIVIAFWLIPFIITEIKRMNEKKLPPANVKLLHGGDASEPVESESSQSPTDRHQ